MRLRPQYMRQARSVIALEQPGLSQQRIESRRVGQRFLLAKGVHLQLHLFLRVLVEILVGFQKNGLVPPRIVRTLQSLLVKTGPTLQPSEIQLVDAVCLDAPPLRIFLRRFVGIRFIRFIGFIRRMCRIAVLLRKTVFS